MRRTPRYCSFDTRTHSRPPRQEPAEGKARKRRDYRRGETGRHRKRREATEGQSRDRGTCSKVNIDHSNPETTVSTWVPVSQGLAPAGPLEGSGSTEWRSTIGPLPEENPPTTRALSSKRQSERSGREGGEKDTRATCLPSARAPFSQGPAPASSLGRGAFGPQDRQTARLLCLRQPAPLSLGKP